MRLYTIQFAWNITVKELHRITFTKVVALSMQMLDRKPNDEPVMTVEEEASEYEAEPA